MKIKHSVDNVSIVVEQLGIHIEASGIEKEISDITAAEYIELLKFKQESAQSTGHGFEDILSSIKDAASTKHTPSSAGLGSIFGVVDSESIQKFFKSQSKESPFDYLGDSLGGSKNPGESLQDKIKKDLEQLNNHPLAAVFGKLDLEDISKAILSKKGEHPFDMFSFNQANKKED